MLTQLGESLNADRKVKHYVSDKVYVSTDSGASWSTLSDFCDPKVCIKLGILGPCQMSTIPAANRE